jgi:glycine oxidase
VTITQRHHIAIAGAGLLGRLLAWQLLRKGFSVTIYDAGALSPSPAAAYTAAGMISPLSEAVVSDYSVYEMGLFALQQWPRWLAEFNNPEKSQSLFSQRGSLVIAHPQDVSELHQFSQELHFVLRGQSGYRWLGQDEIQALEPDLQGIFQTGLLLEDEGHIDNRGLLDLLLEEIQQLGGLCVEHCPVAVAPHNIICANQTHSYDLVIDCRGMGSKTPTNQLRGVRGETLHVETREVTLQRPVRLMHPRYQLYIVPKPQHRFIIGATQIESEDRSPVTLQSSLELSSALYTLAPAFAEARILELGVNLRPAYMDNMPKVNCQDGLISANGLFRHGFLLAPAVASYVIACILQEPQKPFASILTSDENFL